MWGTLLIGAAVVVGAILLNRSGLAAKLGPDVPGDGGDPERRTPADVRDGWAPRVMELRKPAAHGMVGCGRRWFRASPLGGRITNSPSGLWFAPGFTHDRSARSAVHADPRFDALPDLDFRACRPPPAAGGSGGARRSWWQAIDAAWGNPTRGTVPDSPYLAGHGEWEGPEGTVQVMAVTIGGVAYTRSDQHPELSALSVRGGHLWIANEGWMAVDAKGRDLPAPRVLYKGQDVPAASWPGSLAPWSLVVRGSKRTAMVSKGDRHDSGGHVAPYDIMAPVYVWALLQRPRVLVGEVKA